MGINLTVIFGAGAALDVVNFQSNQQVNDPDFRPPTTTNLFHTHKGWEDKYKKFKAIASLVQELRQSLPGRHKSVNVEGFLKTLRDSSKVHRNNQFRQLPLYLQYYFYKVSTEYCKWPANYCTLISKIFDLDLNKVIFVTTNYDLLFDQALELNPATAFSTDSTAPNKYVKNNDWAYIKIHGSVDWGRNIKESMIQNKGNTLPALVDNVDQLGDSLEEALETEIVIDKSFISEQERGLVYPAISVPVGESKLNCWSDHIQVLRNHLNQCLNYLIIGFSGYDKDILKMLDEKEGGFGKVLFVSSSEADANEARENFRNHGNLRDKLHAEVYAGNGFDEFVRNGTVGLNEYLSKLL